MEAESVAKVLHDVRGQSVLHHHGSSITTTAQSKTVDKTTRCTLTAVLGNTILYSLSPGIQKEEINYSSSDPDPAPSSSVPWIREKLQVRMRKLTARDIVVIEAIESLLSAYQSASLLVVERNDIENRFSILVPDTVQSKKRFSAPRISHYGGSVRGIRTGIHQALYYILFKSGMLDPRREMQRCCAFDAIFRIDVAAFAR